MKANVITIDIVKLRKSGDVAICYHDGSIQVTDTPEHAIALVKERERRRAKRDPNNLTAAVVNWYGFGDDFTPPKEQP